MISRPLLVFLLYATTCLSAGAQVPYEFAPGGAANAEEVNANFDTLVEQINQLQADLAALTAAPTMANVAGTYDFFDLGVDVNDFGGGGFGVGGFSATGTVVLNANGTGTLNFSENYNQLNFFTEQVSVGNPTNDGSLPVNSTQVNIYNESPVESEAVTWTLSGNVLTLTSAEDGPHDLVIVKGGNMAIASEESAGGEHGITIAVKR